MRSETSSSSQCQIDTTTSNGAVGGRADSPLDFSTKKKFKPEPLHLNGRPRLDSSTSEDISITEDNPESPCSRLRNILSMKSPLISEDMAGTILNLSKESPLSTIWCKSESQLSSNSNNSESCSPPLSEHNSHNHSHNHPATAFLQSNSPRPATIPLNMGASTPTLVSARPTTTRTSGEGLGNAQIRGVGEGIRNNSSNANGVSVSISSAMGLPSWGSAIYSPSISPLLNQTVPANGGSLPPLSFETSPTLFPHHIGAGAGSPSLSFPNGLSLPLVGNGPSPGNKGRVTRPFKAYPKDPLSFSSVGLYGLPLGTAPGTTEAVIHQQSNQAYAEFRKQMLGSSQFGKCRRGHGHRSNGPYPTMDSMDGNTSDGGGSMMMRANDSGSASDDGNSLINGKNRLGKTEQQMKDEAYWERRRKNNEAAKRSRDARRAKEDEIAIRAAFLEQENLKLRFEMCALKSEMAKLRGCMFYSS